MSQATFRMNRENNREDKDRNPFQRNNQSSSYNKYNNRRSDGSNGYQSWKARQSAPVVPKEKVLTADDFPSLPSAAPSKPKAAWVKPEVTLAERVKEVEENRMQVTEDKEEDDDSNIVVIPLSKWMREKHNAKKLAEEQKQREIEEEEANYRWQISKAMFPPKPEKEMPIYDAELADEMEDHAEGFEYEVVEEPEYEERR